MSHTKAIPLGREPLGAAIAIDMGEPHYPHLCLDEVDDERLADLPDKGRAEIKFKVISRTHHERDAGGKKRRTTSLVLEIQSLEPGHDPKFNGNAIGKGLDKARDSFKKNFKD